MFSNENKPFLSFKYECKKCNYISSKKSNYNNHIRSAKHKKSMVSNENKLPLSYDYICQNCNKTYKDNSGLWRHKKKCLSKEDIMSILSTSDPKIEEQQELISYLLKENSEFKQLMIDQNKQMMEQNKNMLELAKNSGSYNTNNSHNTNFNLNFFLNETCKNAMNIMDFVSQLQVGIKDLEETGRLGFAEGISKIFINGLKQMDISDRPIHCSDSKREIMYVKDKDQWNKETDDKTLLTTAIKHVAHKNIKQIKEWTNEHPEFNDSTSKENDRYLRIVSNSMNGINEEETNKNYNKIIKNIVKETVINK